MNQELASAKDSCSLLGQLSLFGMLTAGSDGFTLTNEAWWKVWFGSVNWVCHVQGKVSYPSILWLLTQPLTLPYRITWAFRRWEGERSGQELQLLKFSPRVRNQMERKSSLHSTSSSLPKTALSGKVCPGFKAHLLMML